MKSIKDKIEQQQKQALDDLLAWAGTPSYLAKLLDVSPQVVNGWIKRGKISATKAIEADKITRGVISKRALRPDVQDWIA